MMTRPHRRLLAGCLLAAVLLVRGLTAWYDARALTASLAGRSRPDFFVPGLIETVETITQAGVPLAFGPHHDRSPYLYHRLTEMLYPVRYLAPFAPEHLQPGDPIVLFPGDDAPVPVRLVLDRPPLRVVEVLP